jgi:hypothetical protein
MLTRRIKKLTKSMAIKVTGRQYLLCTECGEEEVEVPADIGKVTCAQCVQKMIAPPESVQSREKSDKPRGWHFKAYFEHDGVVYSRGKVVTDPAEIKLLKNAPPSPATPKIPKKRGRKNARTTK